jgi:hypothetical protein
MNSETCNLLVIGQRRNFNRRQRIRMSRNHPESQLSISINVPLQKITLDQGKVTSILRLLCVPGFRFRETVYTELSGWDAGGNILHFRFSI